MFSRSLALSAAVLCALWAQGVVLCAGDGGHTEFEVQGMTCCPTEDGDCHDCEDTASPDPLLPATTSAPKLGPAADGHSDHILVTFGGAVTAQLPNPHLILASLRSVVLLV